MSNNNAVNQIISFLKDKIANREGKLKEYESPIMRDMAKNNSHLQFDYIRLKAELESFEDILLTIEKFAGAPADTKPLKDGTSKKDRQG
jgi:hypothetical protein